MKVVVYTSIMVLDPVMDKPIDMPGNFEIIPGWDYVLLTNLKNGKKIFEKSGWNKGEIRIMEPPEDEMPSRTRRGWAIYAARWCKWHPDRLFGDYDIAIWVDGCQVPNFNKYNMWNNFTNLLMNNEYEYDILFDTHKKNNCIYDEHKSIVFCQKDTDVDMLKVTKYIKVMGCPTNLGLFWTRCYIYRIGSKNIQKTAKYLWDDMLLYTYRDQALLTFEIWRNNQMNVWGKAPLDTMITAVDTDSNHGGYL